MNDRNLNVKPGISKELLSEESEDYTLDDIIQLHKVEDETISGNVPLNKGTQSVSTANNAIKTTTKALDYNLNIDSNNYNLKDLKDIDAVLKRTLSVLGSRVNINVNRFSNMTHCEEVLQVLYQSLENISKLRGNAKEIIEIGTKIELVETEKQKQFINQEEINKTIEDIKSIVFTLVRIQRILESKPNI